jgi:hypothetical protein
MCHSLPCTLDDVPAFQSVYVSVIVEASAPGPAFSGAFYSLREDSDGTLATHLDAAGGPGFLQAPGSAPGSSGWSFTDGCLPGCTVVANHRYLILAIGQPVRFSLGAHEDLGFMTVLDCGYHENDPVCAGEAAVNSYSNLDCGCGGVAGEETSWGGLKNLYRGGRP